MSVNSQQKNQDLGMRSNQSDKAVTHILGSFYDHSNDSLPVKRSSFDVKLKNSDGFDQVLRDSQKSDYQRYAGASVSDIFFAFSAASGASGYPTWFNYQEVSSLSTGEANAVGLLPFEWNPETQSTVKNLNIASSGDTFKGLVTSDQYYGNVNRLRDTHDVRGIGLRLPIIGVGWGYTLADGTPFPPASGDSAKFAGDVNNGWEIDPKHYISAPIDLRYDEENHVWKTGGEGMTKHRHLLNTTTDGGPAFATFFADSLTEASGLGYANFAPSVVTG